MDSNFTLTALGWGGFFERQISDPDEVQFTPARVVEEFRDAYRIVGERGESLATLSGRARQAADAGGAWPSAGDWVLARVPEDGTAAIQRVLARRTCFSRKAAGDTAREQVIAANVDVVFVVQSLNRDLNPRRLERYLALLWESGARPVVVLSKADLAGDAGASVAEVELAAPGADVLVTSSESGEGIEAVRALIPPGSTAALVGSSGVGKSTLVNALAGEARAAVREIRDDDRGRHTTTTRCLTPVPGGGLILDTPGMRELGLLGGGEGLEQAFEEIAALASTCRFADCAHESEPGCAVQGALRTGALPRERFESYLKLKRELAYAARKHDVQLRLAEQKRWKQIHLEARRRPDKRRV